MSRVECENRDRMFSLESELLLGKSINLYNAYLFIEISPVLILANFNQDLVIYFYITII